MHATKHILRYLHRYLDLGCSLNKGKKIIYMDISTLITVKS